MKNLQLRDKVEYKMQLFMFIIYMEILDIELIFILIYENFEGFEIGRDVM